MYLVGAHGFVGAAHCAERYPQVQPRVREVVIEIDRQMILEDRCIEISVLLQESPNTA